MKRTAILVILLALTTSQAAPFSSPDPQTISANYDSLGPKGGPLGRGGP